MNAAFLSLGGNLGMRVNNLRNATSAIEKACGEVVNLSSVYETPPLGYESQHPFLNMVVQIRTNFDPLTLLAELRNIENTMGRDRSKMDRTIDIDIIYFNDLVMETTDLVLPHPRRLQRLFVLLPMNDVAPHYHDPVTKQTMEEALRMCVDDSIVHLAQRNLFQD